MITLEKTVRATKAATIKQARSVIVTIEGDMAATIRDGAKAVGIRPDAWALQCMKFGDIATSDAEEAKAHRVEMALHTLASSGRQFIEVVG